MQNPVRPRMAPKENYLAPNVCSAEAETPGLQEGS